MKTQGSNMGTSTPSSSRCCNWPWLLYLLVILALVLSGLNFWMNIYRHEKLRFEVDAIDEKLNRTIEAYRLNILEVSKLQSDPDNWNNAGTNTTNVRLVYEVSR